MYTKEELQEAIINSSSISGVIRYLGLNKSSGTYRTIEKRIDEYRLVPNFTRKKHKKYSHETIFCERSTYDRKSVRNKIIKENFLEYKCSICNIFDWNNQPLSLQLDHINGVRDDNRLENLRFLCPNCHTQTSTWGINNNKNENF